MVCASRFVHRTPSGRAALASPAVLMLAGLAHAAAPGDGLLPSEGERRTRYDVEYPAIHYGSAPPGERIAALQGDLDRGALELDFDTTSGYLRAVLDALDIDTASQLLVFSRTSVNVSHIRPQRPRAIFFNDDAYVAWVPGSGMLEVATMDPRLGPVFFVLEQRRAEAPQFDRQTVQCLRCHDSLTMTGGGVPRFILGSGYVDTRGNLVSHEGWILTSPQTPLKFRWGGWYVTGTHGEQAHLGNIVVDDPATLQDLDSLRIYNRKSVADLIDVGFYPSSHSDIVALLVIEHQVHVHNLITRVNWDVRTALAASPAQQESATRKTGGSVTAETNSYIERAAEPLVKAMLFAGEAELEGPVSGTTEFARRFEKRGPYDDEGRSLRQFDLRTRTFRYPLSYLVYSAAFDALPAPVRQYVYRRFAALLGGEQSDAATGSLVPEERMAMLEILRATKPSFAAWERDGSLPEAGP